MPRRIETFQWRDTLKAIKPPFFARMGCALFTTLVACGMLALVYLWLSHIASMAYDPRAVDEFYEKLTGILNVFVQVMPGIAFFVFIVAFVESFDFLVWLKLPLYPPTPPKHDPHEERRSPRN